MELPPRPRPMPRDEIIASYISGESLSSICRRYRIGSERVKRMLSRRGVTVRSHAEALRAYNAGLQFRAQRGKVPLPMADIVRCYKEGTHLNVLAARHRISLKRMRVLMRRSGVPLRTAAEVIQAAMPKRLERNAKERAERAAAITQTLGEGWEARLKDAYLEGCDRKMLSARFGLSDHTVEITLRQQGVPFRSWREVQKTRARLLRQQATAASPQLHLPGSLSPAGSRCRPG